MNTGGAGPTAEALEWLRNPVWHALRSEHAGLSLGDGPARRYRAEYIPFAGLASREADAFDGLYELLAPGESIYITSEEPLPELTRLALVDELAGLQMVYDSDIAPSETTEPEQQVEMLTETDVPAMLALKEIAFPGYYGPRAPMLGTYYGVRVDGALVAMAGERLALPGMREVSAVCTHPAFVGRGYAGRLIRELLRLHRRQGVVSFLHLAARNARALGLYERLGFVRSREIVFHQLMRVG